MVCRWQSGGAPASGTGLADRRLDLARGAALIPSSHRITKFRVCLGGFAFDRNICYATGDRK